MMTLVGSTVVGAEAWRAEAEHGGGAVIELLYWTVLEIIEEVRGKTEIL